MDRGAISRLAQACFSSNPAIILGSGASMPHQLPSMDDLKSYLISNMKPDGETETNGWLLVVTALQHGDHLELAMEGKNLTSSLVRKIVELTWKCVNKADQNLFLRSIVDDEKFPLGTLLHRLSQSTNPIIEVITTNYDRVAEYACNSNGLLYSTGFTPGYFQDREGTAPITYRRGKIPSKMIRIWKVHGSLDWFSRNGGEPFSAPLFQLPATDISPLIVTPGRHKFEQTHDEPFRSVIAGVDKAFEQADGFICIGFGFRDKHIDPKLINRCKIGTVPVAVLAQTLTEEAKNFLKYRAGRKYIGLEQSEKGTRVYTADSPDGVDVEEAYLWSLSGYLNLVT